ncbi:hypothetical protein ANANG_G00275370, partial [Anguilla anguilla]
MLQVLHGSVTAPHLSPRGPRGTPRADRRHVLRQRPLLGLVHDQLAPLLGPALLRALFQLREGRGSDVGGPAGHQLDGPARVDPVHAGVEVHGLGGARGPGVAARVRAGPRPGGALHRGLGRDLAVRGRALLHLLVRWNGGRLAVGSELTDLLGHFRQRAPLQGLAL